MSLKDYSKTPSENASVGSVNMAENMAAAAVNDSVRQIMSDVKEGTAVAVDTLAALQALTISKQTNNGSLFYMRGRASANDGGEGIFLWKTGDQSANVAADEVTASSGNGGVWIAPTSDVTGASGAYKRLFNGAVRPEWWGGPGDGSTDDTTAWTKALANYTNIDATGKSWVISSTLTPQAKTTIDLSASDLAASVSTNPIFSFTSAKSGLTIRGGGGVISGTAGSFLKAQGSTTTPSSDSHYAREIRLERLQISSSTITWFCDFEDAVRQVYIDACNAYTVNGIHANGKCVEVTLDKSIIYCSSAGSGTRGIHLESPAGTSYYNEGWHLSDTTVDAHEYAFEVEDIFVLTISGGYIGGTSRSFSFIDPTTTHNREITIKGPIIAAPMHFYHTSGNSFHARIDAVFTGITGANITIQGSTDIFITGTFESSTSGVIAVINDNSYDIVVDGVTADSTFTGGVQINGSNGDGCAVRNMQYDGSGDSVYFAARYAQIENIPVTSTVVRDYVYQMDAPITATTYATSTNIGSVSISLGKGQRGWVKMSIPLSGASATPGAQLLTVTPPTGMTLMYGTSWASNYIYPNWQTGLLDIAIPFYTTAAVASGTLTLANTSGNTLTVSGSHAYFGVVLQ